MDLQSILNVIAGAFFALIGWLGKTLWDAVKELRHDIKEIEIDLPKNYVCKSDIETRFDKIDSALERLYDKLDNKVDK